MANPYSRISGEGERIRLDDRPSEGSGFALKASSDRSSISSDGSDIIYRDNIDEPFSEKDQRFTDEPAMEDGEQGYSVEPRRLRPRKKSRKVLAVLVGIVVLAGTIGVLAGWGYSAPSYYGKKGNKHITLDHVFNGTFRVEAVSIDWVKEGMFSRLIQSMRCH